MNAAIAHAIGGSLALTLISAFFLATVTSELFGTPVLITLVKTWILYLVPLLALLMATAGALGNRVGKGWDVPEVRRKRIRMAGIGANGILVLIPCAFVLARWANQGQFDAAFHAVQAVELVAGGTNIVLLSLNLRAGLALRRLTRRA
jgi:hypothetical protein